ncbi:MAG: DUF3089 domain-containing protein [Pseudomonadota bacterium]|nr:DUF3089 domain-containing protein [Sphingomonas sp.]MDQ3479254.1 DUF3089 domain-containing protein [Pseudomonadota bacterium]
MCARRFLIVIFILTLLTVAAAFAIFQWGGSVLRQQFTPQGHFVAPPSDSAPDYAQAASWISRPGIADDPSAWRPTQQAQTVGAKPAHTFYIHPTTYLLGDRWNAPLQLNGDTHFRTRLFVQSQASAFADVSTVWAPRYRQAAYGAFLLKGEDARQALSLAYSDVAAAFDHFLEQVPAGEPIIVAGHSQGALHLMRLLEERKADIAGRVVAAYVVGWPISRTADLPALSLPACASPEQTGCILSWISFGDPANPSLILDSWEKAAGPTGQERRRQDMICVNPISGTEGSAASPADNPGTLVPTRDLASAGILSGRVGAHCEEGLLKLDGDVPSLGPYVLPGNNYHVYDYALFWGAIARDAARRTQAWGSR